MLTDNYMISKEITNYYRSNFIKNEKLNNSEIRYKVINDVVLAKAIKYCGKKIFLKNDKAIYLLLKQGKIINILDIYNLNTTFKEKEVFLNDNTEKSIPEHLLNVMFGKVFTNSEVELKRKTFKRLIKIDKNILYCIIEETNYKVRYNIKNLWDFNTISKEDLEEINRYFNLNENEKDLLADKLGIIDKLYPKIEQLQPEEVIYQKVLNGELKKFPHRFWQDDLLGMHHESAKICMKYLFEKILKWNKNDIRVNLSKEVFVNNKLGGMLNIIFGDNLFYALDCAYPNEFKPFELKNYDSSWYWSLYHEGLEHALQAKDYLNKCLEDDNIVVNYNNLLSYDWYTILARYHLLGIITSTYNNDLYLFFKEYFGKEFTVGEIETYKYKFRIGITGGYINLYR